MQLPPIICIIIICVLTGCTMVGDYYYTDEHLGGGGGKANPLFLSLYHEPLIKTTRTKYKIIHQHIFNYNNNYCYIIYLYQEYINKKNKRLGHTTPTKNN